MEAMDRVHVVRDASRSGADGRGAVAIGTSRAWTLDTVAFHAEFDELYGEIDTAEGFTRMRWLATQTWRSTDEPTHPYIALLRTSSACADSSCWLTRIHAKMPRSP